MERKGKTAGEIAEILRQRGLLKEVIGMKSVEQQQIQYLTYDSREVREGTLFICKGAAFKKEYLKNAVKKGAIAYLAEDGLVSDGWADAFEKSKGLVNPGKTEEIQGLVVTDIRKAMAVTAAVFYGYEPGSPKLTGITGTKGKTTTAWYLKAMLDVWQQEKRGHETGLISTVENYDGIRRQEAVMTTPEAPVIHQLLANAKKAGLSHMTMEVSSQALKYKRVKELLFQVGIFLNISEDHISPQEHQDFEDYFSSKLSVFRQTEVACINLDCEHNERVLKAARKAGRVVTFGFQEEADIRYSEVKNEKGSLTFRVVCKDFDERFSLGMKGRFNVENAVAAIAAAHVYGVPVSCMKLALERTRVPGRMETFSSRNGKICGLVDFAHNRLSFEKLFDAVYQEYASYKNIITVFGCPGGKSLNRRRELGIIAGLLSDCVCITSDSPGSECPEAIASEIRSYVDLTGCCSFSVTDRDKAVQEAVKLAAAQTENTLILVLGRGCEKFQKIGNKICVYPTDAELVQQAIKKYDEA